MKRVLVIALICMLCLGTAYAAQWPEGRSPAQPYAGVPAVDLDSNIGYMLMYPTTQNPARGYCDTLYIYLPRQDVALGDGSLKLMDATGELASVDFSDPQRVRLYPLDDETLESVRWGGGMAVEIRLPVSLPMGGDAWIALDEGCLTAAEGSVLSGAAGREEWPVLVEGDYGVGGLRFTAAEGDDAPIDRPGAGDLVRFDVQLGGAALVSENETVTCDAGMIFEESGAVTLRLEDDDFAWTLLFMDGDDNIVDYMDFNRASMALE